MNFDTATTLNKRTRVSADDRTAYDSFAIALHWFTAVLVLAQFALAETWGWFARPTRHLLIVTHMSFGMILSAVIVIRIVWRLMSARRMAPAGSGWSEAASKLVHYLLYAMLGAEAVLGFVLRWSENRPMSLFGLLFPPPFEPFSRPAHRLIGEIHNLNGWAIILLAAGHAFAALYHHYVLRDRMMARMLPLVRERSLPARSAG